MNEVVFLTSPIRNEMSLINIKNKSDQRSNCWGNNDYVTKNNIDNKKQMSHDAMLYTINGVQSNISSTSCVIKVTLVS